MRITRIITYHLNRLNSSRVFFGLGLAACLVAPASAAGHRSVPSAHTSAKPVPVTITWAMAERFGPGYDRNRDGRPDLENSHEYVNPGRYEVRLDACVDAPAVALSGHVVRLDDRRSRPGDRVRATGPNPVVQLPQGTYTVRVTVQLADGRTGSAQETIRVKDILIIVLGDSLATGEGNPEEPAGWEGAEKSARGWQLRPGRLDPSTPARWADGGPDGDEPRVTPAGILPAGQCLARSGPSLDPLGTGSVRDAPGGGRPTHIGHVRVPGRHRRADRRPVPSRSIGSEPRLGPWASAPGTARRAPCHRRFPAGRYRRPGPRHERFPRLRASWCAPPPGGSVLRPAPPARRVSDAQGLGGSAAC